MAKAKLEREEKQTSTERGCLRKLLGLLLISGQIKVKQFLLSILLRSALGAGRRGFSNALRGAIQYKTNIGCYFTKVLSHVPSREVLGIKVPRASLPKQKKRSLLVCRLCLENVSGRLMYEVSKERTPSFN